MDIGETIRLRREKLGWSQKDLADKIPMSQQSLHAIETGKTRKSKYLPNIAKHLQLRMRDLDPGLDSIDEPTIAARPVPPLPVHGPGPAIPVYTSAEGGPGELIRSIDPVDWMPRPAPVAGVVNAYGLRITGESMFPEYQAGETAIVDPSVGLLGGEVYIFYSERDGEARATIKRLRRHTTDHWHVSQWNPPPGGKADFTLSRREWTIAHRVVGKYSRK